MTSRMINIGNEETWGKLNQLKAKKMIFQTTKLIDFLVDQELEKIKNE